MNPGHQRFKRWHTPEIIINLVVVTMSVRFLIRGFLDARPDLGNHHCFLDEYLFYEDLAIYCLPGIAEEAFFVLSFKVS